MSVTFLDNTDKAALQSGIEKNAAAIVVERARITNLANLPEGGTTGDAELRDIRVGYDGRIYECAGDHVRAIMAETKGLRYKYDFNGDGVVNEEDAIRLQFHVNFPNNPDYALSWWSVPDFNGDGVVNSDDATDLAAALENGDPSAFVTVHKTDPHGVANALKGTASGAAVALTDVSPLEHEIGVKLASKNVLDLEGYSASGTKGELTHNYGTTISTTEPVNSLTVTQTQYTRPDAIGGYQNGFFILLLKEHLKEGQEYTLSCDVEILSNPLSAYEIPCLLHGGAGSFWLNNGTAFEVGKKYRVSRKFKYAILADYPDRKYIEFRNCGMSLIISNIQIELGTTATAYTPFVPDLPAVTLTKYGNNLVDYRKAYPRNSNNTVTIDKSIDGLRWTGSYYFEIPVSIPAGTTLIFNCEMESAEPSFDSHFNRWDAVYTDGTKKYVGAAEQGTGVLTLEKDLAAIRPHKANVNDVNEVKVWNLQLEIGDTATEYEPFKGAETYNPKADGTVEGVASLAPTTTLATDTEGVIIDATYNRDTNKVIESLVNAIISLGGNV